MEAGWHLTMRIPLGSPNTHSLRDSPQRPELVKQTEFGHTAPICTAGHQQPLVTQDPLVTQGPPSPRPARSPTGTAELPAGAGVVTSASLPLGDRPRSLPISIYKIHTDAGMMTSSTTTSPVPPVYRPDEAAATPTHPPASRGPMMVLKGGRVWL